MRSVNFPSCFHWGFIPDDMTYHDCPRMFYSSGNWSLIWQHSSFLRVPTISKRKKNMCFSTLHTSYSESLFKILSMIVIVLLHLSLNVNTVLIKNLVETLTLTQFVLTCGSKFTAGNFCVLQRFPPKFWAAGILECCNVFDPWASKICESCPVLLFSNLKCKFQALASFPLLLIGMKVKVPLHIPVTQGSNNLTIQVTAPIDVLGLNSLCRRGLCFPHLFFYELWHSLVCFDLTSF